MASSSFGPSGESNAHNDSSMSMGKASATLAFSNEITRIKRLVFILKMSDSFPLEGAIEKAKSQTSLG